MWEWGGEIGFEIGLGELNRDDSRERERDGRDGKRIVRKRRDLMPEERDV